MAAPSLPRTQRGSQQTLPSQQVRHGLGSPEPEGPTSIMPCRTRYVS